jgi:hypothetical protein
VTEWTPTHEWIAQFLMGAKPDISPCEAAYRIVDMVTASGMEARQGGNEVPSRSDDSPTAEGGDAQTTGDK